eukprot:m.456910 g.456910  ORF g.456910 m.456910 type:complete len:328 (-) comp21145_c0_seq1:212-1195(-)
MGIGLSMFAIGTIVVAAVVTSSVLVMLLHRRRKRVPAGPLPNELEHPDDDHGRYEDPYEAHDDNPEDDNLLRGPENADVAPVPEDAVSIPISANAVPDNAEFHSEEDQEMSLEAGFRGPVQGVNVPVLQNVEDVPVDARLEHVAITFQEFIDATDEEKEVIAAHFLPRVKFARLAANERPIPSELAPNEVVTCYVCQDPATVGFRHQQVGRDEKKAIHLCMCDPCDLEWIATQIKLYAKAQIRKKNGNGVITQAAVRDLIRRQETETRPEDHIQTCPKCRVICDRRYHVFDTSVFTKTAPVATRHTSPTTTAALSVPECRGTINSSE